METNVALVTSLDITHGSTQRTIDLEKRINRLEKDLVRAQDFLQRLLDTIISAVIVADSSGTVTLANDVAAKMFSPGNSLIGRNIIEILPFDDLLLKASPLERSDSTLYGEASIMVAGQHNALHAIYSISHVVDPNGEQEGLVSVFTDITSRKLLEQQLLQSQKLEAVGHLAAGVAHEINTPIQYIRDNTMFFKEEFSRLKELIEPYLSTISQSNNQALSEDLSYAFNEIPNAITETLEGIESVAEIVRSMKEFSHPGSAEMVETDINKAIEATAAVSKNEWKYVANLVWELEENLPPVACYPGEINQVFLNLLVNSAQALEEKMDVTGNRNKGEIKLKTSFNSEYVRIEITDNGNGIPKEVQNRIFEPFFTTKPVGKGTGQGLSIAYSCIQTKHKGKLEFESTQGVGTTFTIDLPI